MKVTIELTKEQEAYFLSAVALNSSGMTVERLISITLTRSIFGDAERHRLTVPQLIEYRQKIAAETKATIDQQKRQ